jgi:SAM-dependent methyltransferase
MSDPRSDELIRGYALIARGYREQLGDELVGKPLDRAFLDAFVERVNGMVVDVGCGPGHVASYLATRGALVEGVDLSPEMIAEAKATHSNLVFRVADMFALPYANESLGGIVAFYAIVHLKSGELVTPFREFHRVLAPGGLCMIAFHAGTDTIHVDEMFGATTSLDFRFHSPDAVIEALTTAGFTIEARLDRAPYPDAEHPSQRTYLLARR